MVCAMYLQNFAYAAFVLWYLLMPCIILSTTLLCSCRIVPRCIYVCMHWLSVGLANDSLQLSLSVLHVRMFISCVNEHSNHFCLSDYCFDLAMNYCFCAYVHFCLIMLILLHMLIKFSAYNDIVMLLCFRSYLFICSRALQILELGVSEFSNCSQLTC